MEEVHLWRGTPEQRALRFSSRKVGQFSYFDQQLGLPSWRGKTVLDFGGNQGNMLLDPNCTIRAEDYYCLDVIKEALEEGRKQFPQAHWLHYNRYNCSFNPDGLCDAVIPEMGAQFAFILAYSVFTHTTREDMHELIAQLQTHLQPGGRLAFTLIDPHYSSWPATYRGNNLEWRLEAVRRSDPATDLNGLLKKSRDASWCSLVNGNQLYVNSNGIGSGSIDEVMTYHVFYSMEFMQQEFPNATIRPPVNGEMQHCCIIQRPAAHP
jgi:SAM-dependent methyltransferase